jgi:hypothetical protein
VKPWIAGLLRPDAVPKRDLLLTYQFLVIDDEIILQPDGEEGDIFGRWACSYCDHIIQGWEAFVSHTFAHYNEPNAYEE